MSNFLQLHLLTNYGPSNLNRDDLNRPKTAFVGGTQRLRISSQCLKRAWRTSEIFEEALKGHIGTRTKEIGKKIYKDLVNGEIKEKDASEWAAAITGVFGKCKKNSYEIEQLVHFSPEEITDINNLVKKLIIRKTKPSEDELDLLRKNSGAADIAMFGRMLASTPIFNVEAAVQVAHAFTVHTSAVEDDWFTAVDDLNMHEEDSGSAHLGEIQFGSGLFYLYICIDCELLKENLPKNEDLAEKSIKAMVEAAATVSPTGKQNSFASRSYASYILAEKGNEQPRSLAAAFLKPVEGKDILAQAIDSIKKTRENFGNAYGCSDTPYKELRTDGSDGAALPELLKFCTEQ